jgi:hypothetical protein
MKRFFDILGGVFCFFVAPCINWPELLARIF